MFLYIQIPKKEVPGSSFALNGAHQ